MKVQHSTTPRSEKRTDRKLARQWNSIDWIAIKFRVNRLQTRIAKATQNKNWNLVKRLMYLLTHSYFTKLLAVRIVTQNHGKRTAGVDGKLCTTASDKMQAAISLTDKHYHAHPLHRIYIPKPGKSTKRPLSIPTMSDRAMQTLYALALQPVAETTADTRSFGFRLFKCAQDASIYAFRCLWQDTSSPWILEGDIKGCFDNISHSWLKNNIPIDRSILSQFLKSGFIFDDTFYHTDKGAPQGSPISPLLANMTLDGIEKLLKERLPKMKVYFIRYSDDFLVITPSKEIADEVREIIHDFLAIRGLELSPEKTVITHIDDGFDFLGWNFRKYKGKLLIKPSQKSIKSITQNLKTIVNKAKSWTQNELIKTLNPVIRGWANYHRHIVAKDTFSKLDSYLWEITWRWGKRRHPNKGHKWVANKYWTSEGTRNWIFKTKESELLKFSDAQIRRHSLLKLDANPYLNRNYFLKRKDRIKKHTPWIQTRLPFFF
ncbi:MAG TPA: group II intron reverse transcriptase/maturase [Methanosarcina sp.]